MYEFTKEQVFFNRLSDMSDIITAVMMTCEGMDWVHERIKSKAYSVLSAGVFGLLVNVLPGMYDEIQDLIDGYRSAHEVLNLNDMSADAQGSWWIEKGRCIT